MTLEKMIHKYGMHELDIDVCKKETETTVYAYCHEHETQGQFMVNHFLEVKGAFTVIKMDLEDEKAPSIHIAYIEKNKNGLFEICGVGGWIEFRVEGDLTVRELTEEEYEEKVSVLRETV